MQEINDSVTPIVFILMVFLCALMVFEAIVEARNQNFIHDKKKMERK